MQNIKKKIINTIIEVTNFTIDAKDIMSDTNLLTDLKLDSLSYIKIIVELEKNFNIEIAGEDLTFEILETYEDFESMILTYIEKINKKD